MSETKPIEWIVIERKDGFAASVIRYGATYHQDPSRDYYRVIEHSAYVALQRELEQAKLDFQTKAERYIEANQWLRIKMQKQIEILQRGIKKELKAFGPGDCSCGAEGIEGEELTCYLHEALQDSASVKENLK